MRIETDDKYIGQRFGNLVVVARDFIREDFLKEKHGVSPHKQYRCLCDCGCEKTFDVYSLIRGLSKSCGCKRSEDLTGKTFGHLYVEGISKNYVPGNGVHKRWICRCLLCGNTIDVRSSDLTTGQKTHCGCLPSNMRGNGHVKDLSGENFGHLHVIRRDFSVGLKSGQHASWICKCGICGSETSVTAPMLTLYGKDRCSNCIGIPLGEAKISELLTNANIPFDHDTTYKDCIYPVTGYRLRFDFVVHLEHDYIIEYDGAQHYKEVKAWERKINLSGRIDRDNFKNKWCKDNNIPIIRIPYTHLDSICLDDIRPDTSSFLL